MKLEFGGEQQRKGDKHTHEPGGARCVPGVDGRRSVRQKLLLQSAFQTGRVERGVWETEQ